MSDPVTKAEYSAYKDKRQTPAPDGPCTGNKRKKPPKKPWKVYCTTGIFKHWSIYSAATKEQCERWIEKENRGYFKREYRIVNEHHRGH